MPEYSAAAVVEVRTDAVANSDAMKTLAIPELGSPMPEAVEQFGIPLPALVVWLRHVG
jgi:hypothetical protein